MQTFSKMRNDDGSGRKIQQIIKKKMFNIKSWNPTI